MATPLTVNIPDDMLEWAKKVALDSNVSPESILIELMYWNPRQLSTDDVDAVLARLDEYTTVQLWMVVHTHLTQEQSARLDHLIEQGKQNTLSDSDRREMEALLEKVEQYMLIRSEALVLLKQRGDDVSRFFQPVQS